MDTQKISQYLEAAALSTWAVFSPIRAVMATTGALIFADLFTGVWAAIKRKEPVTSKGFSRTVAKILLYETALCMSYLVHQYMTGDLLPADKLVAGMIGIVELKSILENLDTISGAPVFQQIINKAIDAENKNLGPPPGGPLK